MTTGRDLIKAPLVVRVMELRLEEEFHQNVIRRGNSPTSVYRKLDLVRYKIRELTQKMVDIERGEDISL